MRTKQEEVEEKMTEEAEEKAGAKAKRKESAERRKSQKKRDKIARWSGFILLLLVMLVGFLLWVAGEI